MTTKNVNLVASFISKVTAAEASIRGFVRESEDRIHGLVVGFTSKQHVLQVGPPGTAKSLAANLFAKFFQFTTDDPRSYYRKLMSKTLPPDEILGGFDMKAFESGIYRRNIDGFLPTARYAHLDEINKMGPMNQNAILDITDEQRSFRNGPDDVNVPLISLVGSSNEMHEDGAEAHADRLALKYWVDQMQEKGSFMNMLRNRSEGNRFEMPEGFELITDEEIDAAHAAVDEVEVGDAILEILWALRKEFDEQSIQFTNRKANFCIDIVKAEALLAGRMTVEAEDLQILQHVLWNDPSEIAPVRKMVLRVANPMHEEISMSVHSAKQELQNARDSYRDLIGQGTNAATARIQATANPRANIEEILVNLKDRLDKSTDNTKTGKLLKKSLNQVIGYKKKILSEIMNIDTDTFTETSQDS
jgi:MoxR-like ATPase